MIEVFSRRSGLQAVGVADVRVPTQPEGDIWLHFASIQRTQRRYVSASEVLRGKVDPSLLRNKLVLVGLTGTGLTDMRTTALGELVPGIEIQAQVIETIFEGRFLQRPAWLIWAETGFIAAVGLLFIWYLPRGNSRLAVFTRAVPKALAIIGVVLNLLTVSICFALFRYCGYLVDAASIFIILSAVMGSFFTSSLMEPEAQCYITRPTQGTERP
jgi:adenylate cyclase